MKNNKKQFIVKIQEKELVWTRLAVVVLAESKEDARQKMSALLHDGSNPHEAINEGDNSFIQTVNVLDIAEHVESDHDYFLEDTDSNNIQEVDERIKCVLEMSAFDIARWGNVELYNMAEQEFAKADLNLEIFEMELIPFAFENEYVRYHAIPTDYKIINENGEDKRIKPLF